MTLMQTIFVQNLLKPGRRLSGPVPRPVRVKSYLHVRASYTHTDTRTYVNKARTYVQATKSALFEKWLGAGKNWSLLLGFKSRHAHIPMSNHS